LQLVLRFYTKKEPCFEKDQHNSKPAVLPLFSEVWKKVRASHLNKMARSKCGIRGRSITDEASKLATFMTTPNTALHPPNGKETVTCEQN